MPLGYNVTRCVLSAAAQGFGGGPGAGKGAGGGATGSSCRNLWTLVGRAEANDFEPPSMMISAPQQQQKIKHPKP